MKKTVSRIWFLSLSVLSLPGLHALGASGVWNSTSAGANALWTNSLNWSASPYPGVADTALFNNSGNGQTTLDLTGLPGVLNITFDGVNVAAYTIGSSSSQTNVVRDNGEIKLSSTAANNQTFSAAVRLGPDATAASYSLRNDNPGQALTFNVIAGMSGSTKTLNLNGVGPISVLGTLNMESGALSVYDNSSSSLSLAGNSVLTILQINGTNSVINLASGTTTTVSNSGGSGIMAAQDSTINGPGNLSLSTTGGDNHLDNGAATGKTLTINAKLTGATGFEFWHGSYYGTIGLYGTNDYTLSTIINVPGTIQFNTLANTGSACSLGTYSTFVLNAVGSRFCYVGTGDTSDRSLDVRVGGILEQAGTGNLKLTSPILSTTSGAKTLVLQGSSLGTGELSGMIGNGSGTLSLTKDGAGTWTLSSTNTYSGTTLVTNGTLTLSGALGSLLATSGITITGGGTLLLSNTSPANNTNRLNDSAPITISGGTLSVVNDAGVANFSEAIGAVTLGSGVNTISVSQAADGQTNVLRFASLTRNGYTLNFAGTGIGANDRNRIFINGQADGPIGSWATVNGSQFAGYTSTGGVYEISFTTTGIAARGPSSVIPNDANADVHITTDGTSGPITLAGSPTNTIFSLQQDDAVAAAVQLNDGTTSRTLLANALTISTNAASLTIGENAGDGVLSSTADNILLANNETTATLTVNAPIVNNGSCWVSVIKTGPGNVVLAGANTYSGVTAIANGALTFANNGTTQTLAGAISGAGALAKSGSGLLILAGFNTYTGLTTIAAGTVLAQATNQTFGTSAGGTIIASGATLDVGANQPANALMIKSESFTVSGSGVNDRGAIINSSAASQYNALSYVTLAGDTTFGGENSGGRWDLRNTGGAAALQMNGHTLTKVGANMFGLTGVTVSPGVTGSVDVVQGAFTVEAGTTLSGSTNNVLNIRSGAVFDIYDLYAPIVWSLAMADNAHFNVRTGVVTNHNIWAGPVVLNGCAMFDASGSFIDVVRGNISGPGSVVKNSSGSTTYFTGTNTYAGTTTVSNGTLYVAYARSLPGYGDGRLFLVSGGILMLAAGDGATGWNSDQISVLHDASQLTTNTATLAIDTTQTSLTYTGNFTKPMSLTKNGNNRLVLAGPNLFNGTLTVNGGELAFTGATTNAIGTVYLNGTSSLVLSNATAQFVNITSNNSAYIGNGSTDFGRITVAGNASWGGYLYPVGVAQSTLYVGYNGRGILTIQDNATVTQRLCLGVSAVNAAGAVYQNGGIMHNWGGQASDPKLGHVGYGYYELNSGTFTNMGYTQFGSMPTGVGILRQNGGAFKMGSVYSGQLGISRGGTGLVYVAGGTFATSTGINLDEASDNNIKLGYAEFTMGKTAGSAVIGGSINMADRTNSFAIVNLNGGTLVANAISKSSSRTGSVAVVNFNGGTFFARTSGNLIAAGVNAPDVVNIYADGATFDTTNLTCTLPVGLSAPAGSGVSSVTLTPRGGYIGPPFITIAGGGGTGATAIALFDSASGYVNGALVTCPGYGYTNSPTVTLSGGGTNVQTAVTGVSLSANTSGGLTKLGSGTLTLSGTNTYAGATVVSNGILTIGISAALPVASDIVVAGGMLNLGGYTLTNKSFTISSGSLANGALVSGTFTKTGSGSATLGASLVSTNNAVAIGGGVIKLQSVQPGLYEAPLVGAFNTTEAMSTSIVVRFTTRMANSVYTAPYNVTWIYQGYIWNRASTNVTWTFAENFDDNVYLRIDSTVMMTNGVSWNVPTISTITLTPGGHTFEVRFGQGTGGGGPNIASWWTTTSFGFGIDYQGRNDTNIANYVAMTDPGDGSLLTLAANGNNSTNLVNPTAAVNLASGSVLDLDTYNQTFASLSGSGIVSNGTLNVSGLIMPGGDGTIGTLTIANSALASGTLHMDVASDGTSDLLAVVGSVDLSQLSLEIANPASLNKKKVYTLVTVSGTRTGAFVSVSITDSHWHVAYRSDGSVQLVYVNGSCILLK